MVLPFLLPIIHQFVNQLYHIYSIELYIHGGIFMSIFVHYWSNNEHLFQSIYSWTGNIFKLC